MQKSIFFLFPDMKRLEGQVVYKRNVSKNIVFLDLVGEDKIRIRALCKAEICGQDIVDEIKRGSTKVHLGDVIQVSGSFDDSDGLFHLRESVVHLEKWQEKHPKVAFHPQIPTKSSDSLEKKDEFYQSGKNTGSCSKSSQIHPDQTKSKAKGGHESGEHLVSRHQRARIFAEWAVQKFGLERLKKGHVLDIAGGKGDLAFELALKYDLKCTVVDPRGVAHQSKRKYQRKMMKKKKATAISLYDSLNEMFDENFFQKHPTLLKNVSLVVGLHPDQATEPLVDTALAFELPFAVIPCCVFSHENPHRKLKNGDDPNTYESFCQYLTEKNPSISTESLSFRGRNTVLFKT